MKATTIFASLLISITCSTTIAIDCDAAQFADLGASPHLLKCKEETNISLLSPEAVPTTEQLGKICTNRACVNVLGILLGLNPDDCTIPVGAHLRLRTDVIGPTVAHCSKSGIAVTAVLPSTTGPPTTLRAHDGSGSQSSHNTSEPTIKVEDRNKTVPKQKTSNSLICVKTITTSILTILVSILWL